MVFPFTYEALVIGLVRVAGSLPVLRWAFAGAIIAILVDFSDLFMKNLIALGGLGGSAGYQSFDKWLDLVYMVTFLIVALRWRGVARNLAVGLFAFRMIGFAIFEVVQWRGILLIFPNVFEFWFVFVAGRNLFSPNYELTARRTVLWFIALLALKEGQEYVLHWGQLLDRFVATDVLVDWWSFLTSWS